MRRRGCEAADMAMRKRDARSNGSPSTVLEEEQKTRECRGNGLVRKRNLPNVQETRTPGPAGLSEAET